MKIPMVIFRNFITMLWWFLKNISGHSDSDHQILKPSPHFLGDLNKRKNKGLITEKPQGEVFLG